MQPEPSLKNCAHHIIQLLRLQLRDAAFARRHRRRPQDFTRRRVLTFSTLMLFLLQKSLKSLQLRLHEFMAHVADAADGPQVSAGALTHARAKLHASAFVELNQVVVIGTFYDPTQNAPVRRWRGHRLLGIDSSLLRLPQSPALAAHFGVGERGNQHGVQADYPQARISVLYDLLNELGLDGQLAGAAGGERELARAHWSAVAPGDVLINDRGFSGYRWFVEARHYGAHFIGRCSRGSFALAQELFARDEAGVSVTVRLVAPKDLRVEARESGWPLEMTVRFVTVRLPTGELEVLATSLLDEVAYPTECFGETYRERWGIETYYGRLKGRLDLEHFSGQTVAAVEQDFAAMVFLSNLESVICGLAEEKLARAGSGRKQVVQVNRAVSLHALKVKVLELLASETPVAQVLETLQHWMVQNPVSVRPKRLVPRQSFSPARSYHYQRRVRAIVF
jgi:hypothetical protein